MRSSLRLLGAALLVLVAIGNFVGGFAAADYYSGRKLWGFLEGDWFFLFGFIGAGACLAIAVDTVLKTFRGDSRPLPSRVVLKRSAVTTAAGGHASDARVQRMDLARQAIETLRAVGFPVYAVPPSEWPGDVMVGGVWGKALAITLRYDDDLIVERPERRIEVTTTGIEGLGHRAPQDRFLLWEHSYSSDLINFVYNISAERFPERPIPGSERFNAEMVDGRMVPRTVHLESAGPRRLIDAVPFTDGYQMERVAFEDHPALRLYRVQMPSVEILVMGWNWDDEPLTEFARKARPIQDDEALFAEIEAAEFRAWANIDKRRGRDT